MDRLSDPTGVEHEAMRFRPANSNLQARAVLRHDFKDVPDCAYERGDGISHYLTHETQIDTYPDSPFRPSTVTEDVPPVEMEQSKVGAGFRHRLLRAGFALSVLAHAAAALAIGYATVSVPDDETLIEGVTVIAMVVEGTAEADMLAHGDEKQADEPVDDPLEKPVTETIEKPIEQPKLPDPVKQHETIKQPEAKAEAKPTPKDPQPSIAERPEILEAPAESDAKVDPAPMPKLPEVVEERKPEPKPEPKPEVKPEVKPVPLEKRPEPKVKPVEKPAEKRTEKKPTPPDKKIPEKKPAPKKKPEKKKALKGNKGKASTSAKRGEVDAVNKGDASADASRGNSAGKEKGNAARSNYKGLVQKKLQRAKARVRNSGKGSVTVAFTIGASGSVSGLRVSRSSGDSSVDRAALAIVNKAAPFPAIPTETGRKSWPMSVPITFR